MCLINKIKYVLHLYIFNNNLLIKFSGLNVYLVKEKGVEVVSYEYIKRFNLI